MNQGIAIISTTPAVRIMYASDRTPPPRAFTTLVRQCARELFPPRGG